MTGDERAGYDRLTAEVEELRAEVARLRGQQAAHVCAQPYVSSLPNVIPCTCGTTVGCQAHSYPKPNVWISPQTYWQSLAPYNTTCAALAGMPQTLILNT